LEQAGLIRVTHGGATRVLDWRAHGGLDLIGDLGPALWPAAAEMRATIGADAARLCALRSPGIELAELVEKQAGSRTYAARLDAYEALWARIVEGSGNVAYRLAFNSLVAARHAEGFDDGIYANEVDDAAAAGRLAAAIHAGEGDVAQATARALLDRTVSA
jgi:DNA-binding FadR family transcriptional regulator